jgi:hypothetical protein
MLLYAWLGDEAREAGDLDWVVTPESIRFGDRTGQQLLADCVDAMRQNRKAATREGEVEILVDQITMDEIWTYERAPGKRIVVPWRTEFLPPGSVQMDFVFGEELWCEPIQSTIPSFPVGSVTLRTATKELSLAWKLRWLETDMYPQGKDLYDATLLAEQVQLPFELLSRALEVEDARFQKPITPDFPLRWNVDWQNFQIEYPSIQGDVRHWQQRLIAALTPTFDVKFK